LKFVKQLCSLAEILPGIGEFNASTDVGDPALKGSAAYDPKTQSYTLTGAGKNMWFDTGFAIHCNNDHVLSFDGKYIYFNSARTGTMQLRRTSIRSTSTFTCA
jgi:hypothetical protein